VKDALGCVQSALVLGGGSEIAQAIVRRLVADRARVVVLAGRDPATLEPFAQELAAGGAVAETDAFSALDEGSGAAVIEGAWERHGDIDLVLIAFGVLGSDAAEAALAGDPKPALDVARVNYLGAVSTIVSAVAKLRQQGHGTLVVLSSVAAERPRAANFPYSASKTAVDAFAQGIGDALAGTGVDVLVVRPGFVCTRMTAGLKPAPLATTPEVVAETVVEGLRRGAHTVWAPSPVRWLTAVLRCLPRRVFRQVT
jgi:decaprenylphospho-beta-D-erythro-pentofuranosid-2-ulose 2-reductase